MTDLSFRHFDLAARQFAFTGLLATPVVSPWLDPDLYALVIRHEHELEQWCARLGYRLARIDRCLRLRRPPLGARPAVPLGSPPARRPLVWALAVAASLEDQREDSVTLEDLSDALRRVTAVHGLTPYDPSQRGHRVALIAAVRLLATHGVLEQRTQRADLLDDWERDGAGIGAGYLIHRDALVLLVDTRDAELALAPEPAPLESRGPRLLRTLVETQALLPEELDEADRSYLSSQRARLVALAEEMTGGTVEVRADALTLVLPSDKGLNPALFVGFPEATAADWVALLLLDQALAASDPDPLPGRRRCRSGVLDELASTLHATHGVRLTLALREGPAAIRAAATRQLTDAGLLTVTDSGDWVLLPTAARYRNADLATDLPAPTASALFEEGP